MYPHAPPTKVTANKKYSRNILLRVDLTFVPINSSPSIFPLTVNSHCDRAVTHVSWYTFTCSILIRLHMPIRIRLCVYHNSIYAQLGQRGLIKARFRFRAPPHECLLALIRPSTNVLSLANLTVRNCRGFLSERNRRRLVTSCLTQLKNERYRQNLLFLFQKAPVYLL